MGGISHVLLTRGILSVDQHFLSEGSNTAGDSVREPVAAPRDDRWSASRKLEKEPREESRRVLTPVAKRVLSCEIVSLTAAATQEWR